MKRPSLVFLLLAGWLALQPAQAQVAYEGMPTGFTNDGAPYLGSPDAPVVLEEWSDYLCPFCARHFRQTWPKLLDDYVRPGKLRVVFRDLPLAGLHPTAARGHVAARCAGAQGIRQYWAMHDALFSRQGEWNRLPEPEPFLMNLAGSLGLDTKAFESCMADPQVASSVARSAAGGQAAGFNGTPSFRFLAGEDSQPHELSGALPFERFAAVAEALIAGKEPPAEPKPEPPELPLWAKPEGFAPDPARPGYNLAGDAFKGNPEAGLVVIEFSDFQCPACQRHAREAQPAIDAALVEPGKVLWVSKHLPLKMHPQAPIAAAAAECAGDQSQYWKMHDALFEDIGRWGNDDAEAALVGIAGQIGLDEAGFRDCLDSRRAMERVLADLYDAQDIVRTTPSFVLVQDGRGSLMQPLPAEQFVKLLQERLSRAKTPAE